MDKQAKEDLELFWNSARTNEYYFFDAFVRDINKWVERYYIILYDSKDEKKAKKIHHLKIEKDYLEAKLNGDKLFEIRINDRGYQKGDIVVYKEYSVGDVIEHYYEITYVVNYNQKDGWVVFGEKKCERPDV